VPDQVADPDIAGLGSVPLRPRDNRIRTDKILDFFGLFRYIFPILFLLSGNRSRSGFLSASGPVYIGDLEVMVVVLPIPTQPVYKTALQKTSELRYVPLLKEIADTFNFADLKSGSWRTRVHQTCLASPFSR
jgi:hypothetical protein